MSFKYNQINIQVFWDDQRIKEIICTVGAREWGRYKVQSPELGERKAARP